MLNELFTIFSSENTVKYEVVCTGDGRVQVAEQMQCILIHCSSAAGHYGFPRVS